MFQQQIHDLFCDGASSNNGRANATAGYGVAMFINRIPAAKYSVRLGLEEAQTNQRAELQALFHSLRIIQQKKVATTVYTDSMYAINCLSSWAPNWKAKGWRKTDGKAILHLDIIKPMIEIYESLGPLVQLKHVKGHQQRGASYEADGNALADELATSSLHSITTQMALKE